ncbi:WYL domain-containing protein [Spirillospora sp. NPDC047279]|uniref:helix-turn-helix transcriptional regulator n=1 Tax=Spirillospora sp. NPDC047279 TaxID=3155478 RepID=UPI00340858B4
MNRADRLLALTAELRAAEGPLPTDALAARLRVSVRTVRRDLELLTHGGLPVRLERGRGYVLPPDEPPPPLSEAESLVGPVRRTLEDAVRGRRVVRLVYTDQSGVRTCRDVEAHGLVTAPQAEYLVGWCRMRDGPRMFRVDRVGAAYLSGREAGLRDLDELLAALRVPFPRTPAEEGPRGPAGAERARAWTLDRLRHVRDRLADAIAEVRAQREGAAALRAMLGHLAEWTRWQSAAVRAAAIASASGGAAAGAAAGAGDAASAPPRAFERDVPYETREQMIQDAMALRSLGELARDLEGALDDLARWAADCDDAFFDVPLPDPAEPGRRRPLADLIAGWRGPLAHVEWHLDRLTDGPPAAELDADDEGVWVVDRCPLQA